MSFDRWTSYIISFKMTLLKGRRYYSYLCLKKLRHREFRNHAHVTKLLSSRPENSGLIRQRINFHFLLVFLLISTICCSVASNKTNLLPFSSGGQSRYPLAKIRLSVGLHSWGRPPGGNPFHLLCWRPLFQFLEDACMSWPVTPFLHFQSQ